MANVPSHQVIPPPPAAAGAEAEPFTAELKPTNRRRWLLRVVLAAVVLTIFVYVGRRYKDDLHKVLEAKPLAVGLMVLVFIPTRIFTAEVMRTGLRALGHRVGAFESFMLTMVNAYANLLVPRAGLGLPAMYMKIKHRVPVADFSSVQLVPMSVLQVTTIGLVGLVVVALLTMSQRHPWNLPLLALFAALSIASFVAMMLPVGVPERFQNRVAVFLRRMSTAWQRLGRSRGTVGASMLLHAVVLVLRALRLYLAFWAVGQQVNFLGVFVGSLLADIAFFVSITPSALGFREGGILIAAPLIGVTPDLCLAAALLDRIVTSLVVIVFGQIGMWRLVQPVFRKSPQSVALAAPGAVRVSE